MADHNVSMPSHEPDHKQSQYDALQLNHLSLECQSKNSCPPNYEWAEEEDDE